MQADLIVENADLVYTCAGPAPQAGTRRSARRPPSHARPSHHMTAGSCSSAAPTRAAERCNPLPPAPWSTRAAAPSCLVSSIRHTHLVFAGDRRDELQQRLAGASYAEIAADGGGIVKTVAATRAASEEHLVAEALPRLAAMLACGTTTAEVKSGYGLDTASELRMLAGDSDAGRTAADSSWRPRSWARTRFPSTTATAARSTSG